MSEKKDVVAYEPTTNSISLFSSTSAFDHGQRIAMMLSKSNLVPKAYQGAEGLPNCLVALNIANRVGMDVLMVMQNLHVIEGKPSWSSTFMIASLNSCGKFSPLRFEIVDKGPTKVEFTKFVKEGTKPDGSPKYKKVDSVENLQKNMACRVYCNDKETGERLEGPWVSVEMAIREGWYHRNGSKWPTMEDSMLRYRAASFFGRLYAPEVGMGLRPVDEVEDIAFTEISSETPPKADAATTSRPTVSDLNAKAEKPVKTPKNDPKAKTGGENISDAEVVNDEDEDPPKGDDDDDDDDI